MEESLEAMQAQEFIHKITNITLFVMAKIKISIDHSELSALNKSILVRVSGLLVPILTLVDVSITLLAQALFLTTGVARLYFRPRTHIHGGDHEPFDACLLSHSKYLEDGWEFGRNPGLVCFSDDRF